MKIVATIEVRMGSSRLPGKALMDIAGKPLLERVIDRIRLCGKIDDIVIATTNKPFDDAIESFAGKIGVKCYRGSEDDVLDRVVNAARSADADVTVQFGGDSPFIDWQLTDELIGIYLGDLSADLVTNCLELTYPLGVYSYVVPMKVMESIRDLAKTSSEREDVTRYIWEHPERFKLVNKMAAGDLRRPELRLTVDYENDLELTRRIYRELLPAKPDFTTIDVIRFLDAHPEIRSMNSGYIQRSAPHIRSSQKVYKAAIIGCGSIAGGFDERSDFKHIFTHAGAYKNHPRFKLVAVSDPDSSRLAEFKKIWQVDNAYNDHRELFSKEEVDLVSICTPDDTHASIVSAALESSSAKCILEEKPIAGDLRESEELALSCRAKNVPLFLNYNRLWDPLHRSVKSMIYDGFLGNIEGCTAYYVRGIRHNGTTMINTLRFLLGENIVRVQALKGEKSEIKDDISIDGILTTKSGIRISLMASDKGGYGHSIFEIDIMGNKGRIRIIDNGYKAEIYQTAEYKRYPGVRELVCSSPDGKWRLPESGMDRTLLATLDEIALSLDRNIFTDKYATDAVIDMRIAEALTESFKNSGAEIEILDGATKRKVYV